MTNLQRMLSLTRGGDGKGGGGAEKDQGRKPWRVRTSGHQPMARQLVLVSDTLRSLFVCQNALPTFGAGIMKFQLLTY